jgi:hypothetical protein
MGKVKQMTFRGRSFLLSLPVGWGLEVRSSGVTFLGPSGETMTIRDATDLKANSIVEVPGTPSALFKVKGPTPTLEVICEGRPLDPSTAAALRRALDEIEWFPPTKPRRWKWL